MNPMNLDDLSSIRELDTQNMLTEIDGLPEQLATAWSLGTSFEEFVAGDGRIEHVVIAGMGGSAIGGDLLAAYLAPTARVPVLVHRDYGLPAFAHGAKTLVIASSHSGNTEETLDAFETALERGCRALAICTGGELARRANEKNVPLWTFEHKGQPRAAVGFSFGLLLAALARLNLTPDPEDDLRAAVDAMRTQQEALRADVPVIRNPAKRLAGQLIGRWVVVMASGYLAPVARRWKTQINELAKAAATFETLPEADHNTLAGLLQPSEVLSSRAAALFLRAPSDHPRNHLRIELTQQAFMLEGVSTDFVDAHGDTPLAHMWTTLHFGDYVAYYLAISYGVDPTPVEALQSLKQMLRARR
ncbi:MAG: bifunctional phosphoglucose/phosphomannose isomerase [Anaerolineae bacterium]|nr:MAG: bifunctional phosphoglucose/phosphomannose isomerase [Anaerolineae bacterium]